MSKAAYVRDIAPSVVSSGSVSKPKDARKPVGTVGARGATPRIVSRGTVSHPKN